MTLPIQKNTVETEDRLAAREALQLMLHDSAYNTVTSFTANSDQYPDNRMPFVDGHMKYLSAHPNLDAGLYLANVRLKTRIR